MDAYKAVYADKIQPESIDCTLKTISNWRELMNEELSSLLFIKNRLHFKEDIDQLMKEKLARIIDMLERLCNREIEFLSQTISSLKTISKEETGLSAGIASQSLMKNIEAGRNNYNKITSNIDKLIKSSLILIELKQEYIHLHNPYIYRQDNTKSNAVINTTLKPTSESIEREALKNKSLLVREVNKELELLNGSSMSSSMLIPNEIKAKSDKNESESTISLSTPIQSSPSPEEIISKFAESLRLTNYKPKQSLKANLKDFLHQHKHKVSQIEPQRNSQSNHSISHSSSAANINKANPSSMKDNTLAIEKLKARLEDLNRKVKEGCMMKNEKANYEKIKQENAQLNNEVDYLKNCLTDMASQYKSITQQMTHLEGEQLQLKQHNKKLMDYIKAKTQGNSKQSTDNILTSLGMQSVASIDMMNNINKNIERETHYI